MQQKQQPPPPQFDSGPESSRFGVFGALATRLWPANYVPSGAGGESSTCSSNSSSSRTPAASGVHVHQSKPKSSAAAAPLPDLSHLSADERAIIERVLERDARENSAQQQLQSTPEKRKLPAAATHAPPTRELPIQTQPPRSPQQQQRATFTSMNPMSHEASDPSQTKSKPVTQTSYSSQGLPLAARRFEVSSSAQLPQTQAPLTGQSAVPQALFALKSVPVPVLQTSSQAAAAAVAIGGNLHRSEPDFGRAARAFCPTSLWDNTPPEQHAAAQAAASSTSSSLCYSQQRQVAAATASVSASSQVRFSALLMSSHVLSCLLVLSLAPLLSCHVFLSQKMLCSRV